MEKSILGSDQVDSVELDLERAFRCLALALIKGLADQHDLCAAVWSSRKGGTVPSEFSEASETILRFMRQSLLD